MILHLISRADWETAKRKAEYLPAAYATDGFIHCTSGDALMLSVANRFYKGVEGEILALSIDETRVKAPVKWEAPADPKVIEVKPLPLVSPERAADFDDAHIAAHMALPVVEPVMVSVPKDSTPAVAGQPVAPPTVAADPVLFPHIYGPLNRDAVSGWRPLLRAKDGRFVGYGPAEATMQSVTADPENPLNLKRPSQLADELLDATDGVSEAMKRLKDRIEGRMSEIDEKIKKL